MNDKAAALILPCQTPRLGGLALDDYWVILRPHFMRHLLALMEVEADDTDHGPRLRGDKGSLGRLVAVTFSDMPLRKADETPAVEKKPAPKQEKAAPQTYTLDQQQVMAALGIKPE